MKYIPYLLPIVAKRLRIVRDNEYRIKLPLAYIFYRNVIYLALSMIQSERRNKKLTREDVGTECPHDMRPFVQLPQPPVYGTDGRTDGGARRIMRPT